MTCVVAYNSMTAATDVRETQVSTEFKSASVVVPSGTCIRRHAELASEQKRRTDHLLVTWGWKRSRAVGKLCGVAIMLRRRVRSRGV